MAPKKKVVKLDPVPEPEPVVPEPVVPEPVVPEPVPEPVPVPEPEPEPVPEPEPEPVPEPEPEPADDAEYDPADLMDDDDMEEFGGEEYVDDDSEDAGPDVFDILSGLFVSRDGDTMADILANVGESLETHNKLMYKLIKILESKK
jgi:hypothetical protein